MANEKPGYFEFLVHTMDEQRLLIKKWQQFLKTAGLDEADEDKFEAYKPVGVDVATHIPKEPLRLWFTAPLDLQEKFVNFLGSLGIGLTKVRLFDNFLTYYTLATVDGWSESVCNALNIFV